jgi:hypothetical protein
MRAILCASLALATMAVQAQQGPGAVNMRAVVEESSPVARSSLATFGKLVSPENAVRMGFANPAEVQRAQLDNPLGDYMVRLDELSQYHGADPSSLLHSTGLVTYPVKVGEKVQSSVTLRKQDSQWKAVSFGSPLLTTALHDARDGVVKRERRASQDFFQVRVPALNLHFVGHMVDGKLMLTPVRDIEAYGLKKGDTQPAAMIFAKLQPEAARDNGMPR